MSYSLRCTPVARFAAFVLSLAPGGCAAVSAAAPTAAKTYDITYGLELKSGQDTANASITLGRGARNVRVLRFHIDPRRHEHFHGDGEITRADDYLIWTPPKNGGALRYEVQISHRRKSGVYDARMTRDWALFRGGDVFPPATTRTLKGATSNATLVLDLPRGWSAVTPYSSSAEHSFRFDNANRRFDRPTGWILAGQLGVRRTKIAGTRVAIGAPRSEGFRRMDIMAMLKWTLPGVRAVFPEMGRRLVIVGAGDPMWRGGLSGPGSLFLHSDRPLISENGTSTLLHEVVHVAMGVAGPGHDDWLVEGLAEYYSIKVLRTSGTLSARRMELTLDDLGKWGKDVDDLFVKTASGAITARATTLLAALDTTLVQRSTDNRGLDDVVAAMVRDKTPFSYRALCIAVSGIASGPIPMLAPKRVPGAPDITECGQN